MEDSAKREAKGRNTEYRGVLGGGELGTECSLVDGPTSCCRQGDASLCSSLGDLSDDAYPTLLSVSYPSDPFLTTPPCPFMFLSLLSVHPR